LQAALIEAKNYDGKRIKAISVKKEIGTLWDLTRCVGTIANLGKGEIQADPVLLPYA